MEADARRDWPAAAFIAREILGILFLLAGWWKVFELTPAAHATRYFLGRYSDTWIPDALLLALGYTIPFVELLAGLLLVIGWRTREALYTLGGLLIVTTYGHALLEPLFNIDGHTFTRLALILFLLLLPPTADRWSLQAVLAGRR